MVKENAETERSKGVKGPIMVMRRGFCLNENEIMQLSFISNIVAIKIFLYLCM